MPQTNVLYSKVRIALLFLFYLESIIVLRVLLELLELDLLPGSCNQISWTHKLWPCTGLWILLWASEKFSLTPKMGPNATVGHWCKPSEAAVHRWHAPQTRFTSMWCRWQADFCQFLFLWRICRHEYYLWLERNGGILAMLHLAEKWSL